VNVVCIFDISVLLITCIFRINFSTELPYTSDIMDTFFYVWAKKSQLQEGKKRLPSPTGTSWC
jgi:hypothetical protein